MHSSVHVMKHEQKNPHVHTFYDHTKGGVDVADLISSHQYTCFKSPQWPVNALAFLLDTIQTNSKVLIAKSLKPDVLQIFEFTFLTALLYFIYSLFLQPYSIALKIVMVSKVLPCRKSKECFVPEVSIFPSEK